MASNPANVTKLTLVMMNWERNLVAM